MSDDKSLSLSLRERRYNLQKIFCYLLWQTTKYLRGRQCILGIMQNDNRPRATERAINYRVSDEIYNERFTVIPRTETYILITEELRFCVSKTVSL